jgi:RNA polymerase sigma-70 factor (TIGR02957 family)
VDTNAVEDGLLAFASARPRLFGIAYRMLGSAAEAEDIVQDVWVRWQTTDRSVVRDAPAFLATTTTRLAINVVQSARSRRETYVGPWLPEPVDTSADPELGAERGEALEFAVLVLLEKLSPTERAAYVLREAFNYPYREIADILRLEEANTRQLVTRARQHIADGRRAPVSSTEQRRLLDAFIAAAQTGDVAALEGLFASDIASCSDGGGFVRAARIPVVGRERVAKFIAAVAGHFWTGVTIARIEANGQGCVLISREGLVVALVTIGASAQGIDQIMWMMRPSKLAAISLASQRLTQG